MKDSKQKLRSIMQAATGSIAKDVATRKRSIGKGYVQRGDRYIAQLASGQKGKVYLGSFSTAEEAVLTYLKARLNLLLERKRLADAAGVELPASMLNDIPVVGARLLPLLPPAEAAAVLERITPLETPNA